MDQQTNMPKTLIVMLLDESGSMKNRRYDVMDGFNKFVETQKSVENDQARIVLFKFNDSISMTFKCIELDCVDKLSNENYQPNGDTALYDAISVGIQFARATELPGMDRCQPLWNQRGDR